MILRRFRDLPLLWKLLLPFTTLLTLMAALGAFLIVRDLSSRAQTTLDRDLFRRSVEADAVVRDNELSALSSVRLAANLEGMPDAVARRDLPEVGRLLRSVLALNEDLALAVVTDRSGSGIVELVRSSAGEEPVATRGTRWDAAEFVRRTMAATSNQSGEMHSGLVRIGEATMLAAAAPVPNAGVALAGIPFDRVIAEAAERSGSSVAAYDASGARIVAVDASGAPDAAAPPTLRAAGRDEPRRITRRDGAGEELAGLVTPLVIRDDRAGALAVALPRAPAVASVSRATLRLVLILAVAMAALVVIGLILSRSIVRRVRPIVETNRALGRGDLSARAPVTGRDELGELAAGVNQMAAELQASYEQLERRVADRTEELRVLYEEVRHSAEARAQFFTAMSHEIRTPLFAILGHAEMMRERDFDLRGGAWRREFGDTIKESSEHVLTIVNQILDLARFEAGRVELDLEDVRLAEVAGEVEDGLLRLARRAGLSLELDVSPDLPAVTADRVRLKEILLNLASNAIKYTPSGGAVRVDASASNGTVSFRVSDTGIGIPRRAGEKIFEPFFQVRGAKPQRGEASSGLGLAVTKRLVEAHGGSISYMSRPGHGTSFTVSIPTSGPRRRGPAAASTRG